MKNNKKTAELREAVATLRPYFIRSAWLSVCATLLVLAPSAYMLEVFERVVNSRSHMTLAMLTLLVLALYCLMEVLEWARAEIMFQAGLSLDTRLRDRVFDAVFLASLQRRPGGSVQPFNDLRTLREFLYSPALLALMDAPVSLVFLGLMFAISPLLGWAAIAGSLLQVLLGWLNARSTQPMLMQANRSAIAAQQYIDRSLRNAQVIDCMGMLPHVHRRWMEKQRAFLELHSKASVQGGNFQAVSKFLQITMGSLLLGVGAWLLLNNQLNGGTGMIVVGSILGGRAIAPLMQMVMQWRTIAAAGDAWQRLDTLLGTMPPKPPTMPLPAPAGVLRVEGVTAGAPGSSAPIVKNITFSLAPGDVLAVIGPSAAGKTTLARLVVGLWPPAAGKVRLDGADIFSWNKAELGPSIGYLPQEVELIEGTLAENISRFGEADPGMIRAAAAAVGLHTYITSLPLGYQSPVGRDGGMLSGGLRQRLALARAIYGNPVLVVLDEPNSSLDEAGDAALASAIAQLSARGATFVVVTQRTGMLAAANKVLVLRDGTVQAFGPKDEVLAAMNKPAGQIADRLRPAAGASLARAA